MKKVLGFSALLIALTVMPAVAQEGLYFVSVPIERVFSYRLGYVIDYQTNATGQGTSRVYLPREWFNGRDRTETNRTESGMPRGQVVLLGPGHQWPYLAVFYLNGEFSHVRLHLRERGHSTWGGMPAGVNLDRYFEDVTEVRLLFTNEYEQP